MVRLDEPICKARPGDHGSSAISRPGENQAPILFDAAAMREPGPGLLQDTMDLAASCDSYLPYLAFTPSNERAFFKKLAPPSFDLLPQVEGDLGQKMYDIFLQLNRRHHTPVVVIGSDIPTLQPRLLQRTLDFLAQYDVCLGPSRDGGYYLIGARETHRMLFEGLPWSTDRVFEATVARIKEAGLSYALLDTCSDVDTVEDLHWLRDELNLLRQAEGARIPRRTEACLNEISS